MKSFLKKKKSSGSSYGSDNYHGQGLKITDAFGDEAGDNPYQPYVPPPVEEDEQVVYSWSDKIKANATPVPSDTQKEEILNDTMETTEEDEPVQEKEHVVSDTSFESSPIADQPLVGDLFANDPLHMDEKQSIYSAPSEDLPELQEKFQAGFFAEDGVPSKTEEPETPAASTPSKKRKEQPVRISVLDVSKDKQAAMDEIDDLVEEFNASNMDVGSSSDDSSDSEEDFGDLEDLDDEQLEQLIGDLDNMSSSSSDSDLSSDDEEENEDDDDTFPEVFAEQKGDEVVVKRTLTSKKTSKSIEEEKKEEESEEAGFEFPVNWDEPATAEEVSPPTSRDTSSKIGSSGSISMEGRLVSDAADKQDGGLFSGTSLNQMYWDDDDESAVGEDDVDTDPDGEPDESDAANEAKKSIADKEVQSDFGVETAKGEAVGSILLLDKFEGKPVESHQSGKANPLGTAVRKKNRPFAGLWQLGAKKKAAAPKQNKITLAKSPSKKENTPTEATNETKQKLSRSSSKKPSAPASVEANETKASAPTQDTHPQAATNSSPEEVSTSRSTAAAAAVVPETKPSEPQVPETPVDSSAPETSAPETQVAEASAPETSAPETQVAEAPKPKDVETDVETPQEVVQENESEFSIFSSMIQDVYRFTFGQFGASSTEEKASILNETSTPAATTTPTKPEPVRTPTSSEGSQSPTAPPSDQATVLDDQGYEVQRGEAEDEIHEVASGKGFEFSQKIHTILRSTKGKKGQTKTMTNDGQQGKNKSKLKSLFSRKKSAKTTKQ